MARLTKAQREWRPGMPKKRRSIKVTFTSMVLTLEAFVMFFATLVAFGLHKDRIPQPVVLAVGIALSLLLVLDCALLRKPVGYAVGWILQLVIIATGFVEPMMFVVGVLFALSWWYAVRTGARLDRENAVRDAEQAEWERNNPPAAADS
jgi:Protein of unknown function (DUF4233)